MYVIGVPLCLLIFASIVARLLTPLPTPVPKQYVYYTRFGGMYCAGHEITACGLRILKCGDDRVYECMQDVAIKEVE
jgi:hypothetical protein